MLPIVKCFGCLSDLLNGVIRRTHVVQRHAQGCKHICCRLLLHEDMELLPWDGASCQACQLPARVVLTGGCRHGGKMQWTEQLIWPALPQLVEQQEAAAATQTTAGAAVSMPAGACARQAGILNLQEDN